MFSALGPNAGAPAAVSAEAAPSPAVCAAAKAVVDEALASTENANRRMVVSDSPENFRLQDLGVDDFRHNRWISGGAQKNPDDLDRAADLPSEEAARLLIASHAVSAVTACPDLRSYLVSKHVPFGRAAETHATRRLKSGLFRQDVLSFSLPVVTADGREALANVSEVGAPLAGAGFVWHLRRDDNGVWKVTSTLGTWIS
jgi:hypothetical protein